MEKRILSLNSDGKLIVKSADGREQAVSPSPAVIQRGRAIAWLLIDTSSSMYGEKINQVKKGALDFARTAIRKGYLVGLVKFDSDAALLCGPTAGFSLILAKTEELVADNGTNLAPALAIVSQKLTGYRGRRVILVATDGATIDPAGCLITAEKMKKDGVEILAISTPDADRDFLEKLVSRKDLNLKVEGNEFGKGMEAIARKLPVQKLEDKR